MSDLISREALLESLNPEYLDTRKLIEQGETHLDSPAEGYTEVYRLIKTAPTIDAVEVVRCEDCKWWHTTQCRVNTEKAWTEFDAYCSYGKRKEVTHEET